MFSGKEDKLFSPYLKSHSKKLQTRAYSFQSKHNHWNVGAITDQGDLSYLNLVHLAGLDATNPDDLTKGEIEGRYQAIQAIKA